MLGGVGLAIGAGFFFLMSRPEKAKEQPIEGVKSKPVSPK
jgi:preprotein translocase subunit YajC